MPHIAEKMPYSVAKKGNRSRLKCEKLDQPVDIVVLEHHTFVWREALQECRIMTVQNKDKPYVKRDENMSSIPSSFVYQKHIVWTCFFFLQCILLWPLFPAPKINN
jgi:hypothetical protein